MILASKPTDLIRNITQTAGGTICIPKTAGSSCITHGATIGHRTTCICRILTGRCAGFVLSIRAPKKTDNERNQGPTPFKAYFHAPYLNSTDTVI
jgi:hypothetical protein